MKSVRRIHHVLSKNQRNATPSHVIYVDTETRQTPVSSAEIRQEFFLGCAQYRCYSGHGAPDEIRFTEISAFWEFVLSHCRNNQKLVVIDHNQDFDFRVLEGFTRLPALGFEMINLIADGGKFIADYRFKKCPPEDSGGKENCTSDSKSYSITFLDTLNWFHTSLKKLGETVGIAKMEMPVETDSLDDWYTYCMRDVDVLRVTFETFLRFLKDGDFGNFGSTLAKQALNAYRHRFMDHPIEIHTNPKAIELERQSYFGGRTECFFIGKIDHEPLFKLDINSQYPYVMRNNLFPRKLIGFRHWLDEEYFSSIQGKHTFIADCVVETAVPCVPFRFNKRLCFPVGSFRTTLCEPEYRLALEECAKLTVKRIAYYETAPLFRRWVDEMYETRKRYRHDGNEQYQYFCKLLMNSLYGKFGQRTEEWLEIGDCDPAENYVRTYIDADTDEEHEIKAIGGKLLERSGWKEGFDTFVAVASFVTAYARTYLWKLIRRAGIETVYYMDTDSLLVNRSEERRVGKEFR